MATDLHDVRDYEMAAFGEYRVDVPERLPHGEWTLIARYPKLPADGDGQPVEIDVCALPARFYRIRALASTNSVNEPKDAWSLETGSGQHELVALMANAIAEGMLAP